MCILVILQLTWEADPPKQGNPPREPHLTISSRACGVLANDTMLAPFYLWCAAAGGELSHQFYSYNIDEYYCHLQRRDPKFGWAFTVLRRPVNQFRNIHI